MRMATFHCHCLADARSIDEAGVVDSDVVVGDGILVQLGVHFGEGCPGKPRTWK